MRSSIIFMKWARSPQNEAKVPFRPMLPMGLRNRVSGKNSRSATEGCLQEITVVISCLEKNNYENKMCLPETNNFYKCYDNYMKTKRITKEQSLKGILTPGAKNLTYMQINQLLRKYPQV